MNSGTPSIDPLAYHRLRAPQQDGEALVELSRPTLSLAPAARRQPQRANWQLDLDRLDCMSRAREAALQLAKRHTGSYRDLPELPEDPAAPWVMSGHQPTLFHPGVWLKNFGLSRMGTLARGVAVNLVVDNDLAAASGLRLPVADSGTWRSETVLWEQPTEPIPFEEKPVVDGELFRSFGERVARAIHPLTQEPLIDSLWPVAVERHLVGEPLGRCLAAARHMLEGELGLRTLELPLGELFDLPEVVVWTTAVLEQLEELHRIYNRSLSHFRRTHRIRSRAHPVPDLDRDEGWLESPFWVWQRSIPRRRPLWLRTSGNGFALSDRHGWQVEGSQLRELLLDLRGQTRIRPRALMTTLFCRTVLADLFIHGIGGAKYDQLTDAIMLDFLRIEPPAYLTMTATVRLRGREPWRRAEQLALRRQELRDLVYNPQRHLTDSQLEIEACRNLLDEKSALLSQRDQLAARHGGIGRVNEKLQPYVAERRETLTEMLEDLRRDLREDQLLGSRELSLALFPRQELPDKLLDLGKKVDKLSITYR